MDTERAVNALVLGRSRVNTNNTEIYMYKSIISFRQNKREPHIDLSSSTVFLVRVATLEFFSLSRLG